MMILAALVVLSVAAGVRPADQITCPQPILCPCGDSGKYVKICAEEDNPCLRWSNCKTCQDGLDGCLECPEGSEGLWCSKGLAKLPRQKRQTNSYDTFYTRPGQRPVQNPYQFRRGGCPELSSPKLGRIRCSYTSRQMTCVGDCLPGYRFENHESESEITLTCRGNHYTPLREFPPCKSGGHCDLIIQGPGTFNCTTAMSGTLCDVICNGRYMGRYFCFPEQPWEPALPSCVRPKAVITRGVTCPDPGFIENGRRSSYNEVELVPRRSFDVGGKVDYFCFDEAFELQGRHVLTCLSDGKWNNPLPKCVLKAITPATSTTATALPVIQCPDPGVDSNGHREVSLSHGTGFPPGSVLEYSCKDGYDLNGQDKIFCLRTGRWSSERPTCEFQARQTGPQQLIIYCPNPGVDSNGRRNPASSPSNNVFPSGSVLEYSCKNGYDLDGQDKIFCLRTGLWSSERPKCKVTDKTCTKPPSFPNGRIVYYSPVAIGERRRPQTVTQGLEYFIGSLLLYSCNSGYTLQGTDSLTCEENGEWSSDPPVCINDKTCTKPPSFPNGRIVYYPPVASGERRKPQTVTQGLEYHFGSLLLYSCNSGHTPEGIDTLTCEENGEWSSDPPVCISEVSNSNGGFCPDPGVDPNGYREPRRPPNQQGFPHGSRVEYFCNRGYELNGDKALFCLSSGDWLSERPRCIPQNIEPVGAYCPNPGDVANGQVVYYPSIDSRRRPGADLDETMYPEGARLKYSCDPGYNLDGEEFITCQSNGRWLPRPPICASVSGRTIRYCDELGLIANGQVEYFLPLGQQTTSVINGAGYPQYPVGTRLEYSCDIGYVLDGPSKLTCQETGDWTPAVLPNCITRDVQNILYCLSPGPLLNGKIRQYSRLAEPRTGSASLVPEDIPEFPEATTLKYECDEGYTLDGTDTITCTSSGLWTSTPPKCVADCGYSMVGATRRILNGNKTLVGEWPWVVAIAVQRNNYTRIICGGAVLNTRTVITAAHCVTGFSSFILYFGKYFRSTTKDDKDVQVARSERVIIHPSYSNVTMDSDIALIKFKPRIKYSPRVQPICLPTGTTTTFNLDVGKKGYVTGWGQNEKQVDSGELMMAHLPYQSNQDCLDSFRENVPTFRLVLTQNMFCAGYPQANQSTCRGDSGSPFVFFDSTTERHTIEGLVSYTAEGQCGLSGIYSIYTKVYQFIPWIFRNL